MNEPWTVIYHAGQTDPKTGGKVWIVYGDFTQAEEAGRARDRLRAEGFNAHVAKLMEETDEVPTA